MTQPSTSLSGRRILVTGGARGLGADIARGACLAGARVIVADILETEGVAFCAQLAAEGHDAHFVHADICAPASVESAVRTGVKHAGGIDGLVNNAAIATGVGGRLFEDLEPDDWDRVLTTNVRGLWLVTRAALPYLTESSLGGRVVNIASDTALWGAPKLMHYVASKGAVISMTRAMARELGDREICVNAIAPGLTRVEVTESVPQERHDLYRAGRALEREQMPEDVTGAVLFLLSNDARFVTGQTLPVNGGFVLN